MTSAERGICVAGIYGPGPRQASGEGDDLGRDPDIGGEDEREALGGKHRRERREALRHRLDQRVVGGLRGARRAAQLGLKKQIRDPPHPAVEAREIAGRRHDRGRQRPSAPPSRRSRRAGVRAGTSRRRRSAAPCREGRDSRATRPAGRCRRQSRCPRRRQGERRREAAGQRGDEPGAVIPAERRR